MLRAWNKRAEPGERESYAGEMPVAKSAVHLVSQMLKVVYSSRYLLAFIPFSNAQSVLKLYFLCGLSNGILSVTGFLLEETKKKFSHLLLSMLKMSIG